MAAQTSNDGETKTLRVKYTKSAIGYNKTQKATITALGLRKLGQTIELKDTPSIRGMLRKVAHLVTIQDEK